MSAAVARTRRITLSGRSEDHAHTHTANHTLAQGLARPKLAGDSIIAARGGRRTNKPGARRRHTINKFDINHNSDPNALGLPHPTSRSYLAPPSLPRASSSRTRQLQIVGRGCVLREPPRHLNTVPTLALPRCVCCASSSHRPSKSSREFHDI